jgi:signal transduction histidine kinase
VIRGFHELMLQSKLGPITPQQKQALEATERSVTTLTRIAQDATRMAEIDNNHLTLKRADWDVSGLVDQAVAEVRARAVGRRVRLVWTASPGLGVAWVDGPSLIQALVHLVSNAVRFTPDGGTVAVSAIPGDGEVEIRVRDNGMGMTEEQRAVAFEAFSVAGGEVLLHTSGRFAFGARGLGLGLAIARAVVERHGGSIHLESAMGQGTCCVVRLPAAS